MPLNPNVPVPRTPFVDSRGILTNPGLYFLYQVISAAEGVDQIIADVDVLEQETDTLNTRLTAAEGEIDTAQGQITTLQSQVATLQAQVAAIQASATSLADRVTALEEAALDFLVADDPPKLKDPRIDALEVLSWAS